jgi:hypothetical protein
MANTYKVLGQSAPAATTNTDLYTVKDGIIVVKKGAILPDGFTV